MGSLTPTVPVLCHALRNMKNGGKLYPPLHLPCTDSSPEQQFGKKSLPGVRAGILA